MNLIAITLAAIGGRSETEILPHDKMDVTPRSQFGITPTLVPPVSVTIPLLKPGSVALLLQAARINTSKRISSANDVQIRTLKGSNDEEEPG